MGTHWIVSAGAVSCYPAPMVKNLVQLLKFYSYSYKNMQSDGIYVSGDSWTFTRSSKTVH